MISKLRLASVVAVGIATAVPQVLAEEPGVEEDSEVIGLMHDRLEEITDIRANVVMGNLEGARAPAKILSERENAAGLSTEIEPYVEALRKAAAQVAEAQTIESAASAVSIMAANCGYCHMAKSVGLQFGYDQLPANLTDTQTHMQRHEWAIDRLWEGMIGPSAGAWKRGMKMLGEEPLHAEYIVGIQDPEQAATANRIAARVHELERIGADAATPAARSDIYSELVGLCADCHQRLGQGPGN